MWANNTSSSESLSSATTTWPTPVPIRRCCSPPAGDEDDVRTLNGIIDTVSASHPILQLIGLLKTNGKLVMVGGVAKPLELPAFALLGGRKLVARSLVGGIKETQEMIDFARREISFCD
ncbi:putative mannitol dehydrogenase [Trifolium repens]|nr:putative mannitol dehydrogenase [Trifolium repens]